MHLRLRHAPDDFRQAARAAGLLAATIDEVDPVEEAVVVGNVADLDPLIAQTIGAHERITVREVVQLLEQRIRRRAHAVLLIFAHRDQRVFEIDRRPDQKEKNARVLAARAEVVPHEGRGVEDHPRAGAAARARRQEDLQRLRARLTHLPEPRHRLLDEPDEVVTTGDETGRAKDPGNAATFARIDHRADAEVFGKALFGELLVDRLEELIEIGVAVVPGAGVIDDLRLLRVDEERLDEGALGGIESLELKELLLADQHSGAAEVERLDECEVVRERRGNARPEKDAETPEEEQPDGDAPQEAAERPLRRALAHLDLASLARHVGAVFEAPQFGVRRILGDDDGITGAEVRLREDEISGRALDALLAPGERDAADGGVVERRSRVRKNQRRAALIVGIADANRPCAERQNRPRTEPPEAAHDAETLDREKREQGSEEGEQQTFEDRTAVPVDPSEER